MRDTIELAREAGGFLGELPMGDAWLFLEEEQLKRFADLVRADEREACAKTRAGKPRELKPVGAGMLLDEQQFCFDKGWREGAASVRAAIRNRGNT
jgi:hypothetical protein